jgi:hypothetical protein
LPVAWFVRQVHGTIPILTHPSRTSGKASGEIGVADEEEDEKKKKRREQRREKRKTEEAVDPDIAIAGATADETPKKKGRRRRKKKPEAGENDAAEEAVAGAAASGEDAEKRGSKKKKKKKAKAGAAGAKGKKRAKKKARQQQRKKKEAAESEEAEETAATPPEPVNDDAFPMQRLPSDDIPVAFASIEAISLSTISKGRFAVEADGVTFQTYFERSSHKRLFVLLGGGVRKNRKGIPQFERRGWGALVPGSILCIADPTLELSNNLSLGWYIGTRDKDYTAQMARLVNRVAGELGLLRSDIVFYASSGGGFAALMCARHLPGSSCIVVNPQIEIAKHHRPEKRQFAKVFANERNFKPIAEQHGERVSVLAAFPDAASLPPTVYVQNRHDTHHFENHYTVFCETYAAPKEGGMSDNGRILTLLFEHHAGHGPEPRQLVRPLIAQALAFFDRFRQN